MKMKDLLKRVSTKVFPSPLRNDIGASYVDTGVKMLLGIVIGALLLTGIYSITQDVVLDSVETKFEEFFEKTPTLNGGGSGNNGGIGGGAQETPIYEKGDIDKDGDIDPDDFALLNLIHLEYLEKTESESFYDLSGDDQLKAKDVSLLKGILLEKGYTEEEMDVAYEKAYYDIVGWPTYSYNGTELSDINSVWTDKEAYPYACIYAHGEAFYLVVSTDFFGLTWYGPALVSNIDYTDSVPRWIYSNGSWHGMEMVRMGDPGVEYTSIIWSNDAIEVLETGEYLTFPAPVPAS